MPKEISDFALDGISIDLRSKDERMKARHPFLEKAKLAIEEGRMTSQHISAVAERQSLLRGESAKKVHRASSLMRAINYCEAALTIVVAENA